MQAKSRAKAPDYHCNGMRWLLRERRCAMWFFNFVLEHWGFSPIYVLVTATTVFRFRRQIVMKSRWYRKVHYHLVHRWEAQQLQWIGVLVLLVLVLFPVT